MEPCVEDEVTVAIESGVNDTECEGLVDEAS